MLLVSVLVYESDIFLLKWISSLVDWKILEWVPLYLYTPFNSGLNQFVGGSDASHWYTGQYHPHGRQQTPHVCYFPRMVVFWKTFVWRLISSFFCSGNLLLHRYPEHPRPAADLREPREHDVAEHRRGEWHGPRAHHLHGPRNKVSSSGLIITCFRYF